MNTTVLFISITLIVTCLDQLTKYLVYTFMELGQTIPVIEGFFHITYILNDGMAFGKMDNARWVFMLFTPIALAGVAFYLFKYSKTLSLPIRISLSLIFGGGLSNMIDRIFFYRLSPDSAGLFDGRVVDFLDFRGIWQYIFNVADSAAVIGVFAFLFFFVLEEVRASRAEKAKKTAAEEANTAELSDSPREKDDES